MLEKLKDWTKVGVRKLSSGVEYLVLRPLKNTFGDEHGGYINPKYSVKVAVIFAVSVVVTAYLVDRFSENELDVSDSIKKERQVRKDEESKVIETALNSSKADPFYGNNFYGNKYDSYAVEETLKRFQNEKANKNNEDKFLVNKENCDDIYKLLEKGEKLSPEQQELFLKCQKENPSGKSEEELKALNILADERATDKEKELAKKILSKTATDKEKEIFDALTSNDQERVKAAKALVNDENLTDEQREALERIANGSATKEDRDIVNQYYKDKKEKPSLLEQRNNVINEIDQVSKQIKEDEEFLNKNAQKFADIMNKIAEDPSYVPTKEEQEFIDEFNRRRNRLKSNKERLKGLKAKLKQLEKQLSDYLKIGNSKLKRLSKQGVLVSETLTPLEKLKEEEKKVKKKDKTKKSKKRTAKKKKITETDLLSEEEKKLLEELASEEKVSNKKVTHRILNPIELGLIADGSQEKVLMEDSTNENSIVLSPSLKIRAVLEDRIFMTDSAGSQSYNIRILEDVKDITAKKRVFIKNSIAVLTVSGFDANTQLAQGQISTVTNGKEIVNTSISVEIPGAVKKNTGHQLTALIIGEWLGGLGEFFASQGEENFTDENLLSDVIGKATGEAASSITDKVSELIVGDLRDAKAVFFAPRSLRLVLKPRSLTIEGKD